MKLLTLSTPGWQVTPPADVPTYNQAGPTGSKFVGYAIDLLLAVTVIFALVMLLLGALAWITSGGDKDKLEKARNRIIFAIIGLVVAFLGYFIIQIIGHFVGVSLV